MNAVDPHIAVRHHAVKLDEITLCLASAGNRKMLSIPSDAGRKKSASATGGILLIEWTVNAPVVGQRNLRPRVVVELAFLCLRRIAPEKQPSSVPIRDNPRIDSARRGDAQHQRQRR